MSRFVMIDDTDPSIQYSGPWFEANGNNPQFTTGFNKSILDFGLPFNNTLHGVNVNASLSFTFSGSAVIVYGTSNSTTNAFGTQDPTWECFIDNTIIDSSPPSSVVLNTSEIENNWILCGAGPTQLQDGPHLLTVNASVSTQTFWFDQIQYAPSANVSLDQSFLRIDASDSAIQYSPGWQFVDNMDNYTTNPFGNFTLSQTNEANFIYEFSGTYVSSIAASGLTELPDTPFPAVPQIPINFPTTSATYTIDDQAPITFTVGSSTFLLNQISFESGQLPSGQHKLIVTYLGNNLTQRLYFNYLVQQNGAPSSSSTTSTLTGVPSGNSFNSSPGKPSIDAIIGGVIGGLVLISFLIALFFFFYRRNKRRSEALSEMSYTVPSPDVVTPFTLSPLNPTSPFPSKNYTSNGQSLPLPQSIPSKFSHRNQPSDASTSTMTPLRPQFSSPTFLSPSSEPPRLPLTANLDDTSPRPRVSHVTTEPLIQRSPSPQGANATGRFLRHQDSGVRMPPAEDDVDQVELPPLYTPG